MGDYAPCIYLHDLSENRIIAQVLGGEVFLDYAPNLSQEENSANLSFFSHEMWFDQKGLSKLSKVTDLHKKFDEIESESSRPIVCNVQVNLN